MSRSGKKKKKKAKRPVPQPRPRPSIAGEPSARLRLAVLTCLWRRPALTDIVLGWYATLQGLVRDEMDLALYAVGSEGEASRTLAERHGFHYVEWENRPLGEKWNAGLGAMRDADIDAVVIVGSDDLIDERLMRWYAQEMRAGNRLLGLLDLYFFHAASGDAVRWKGYSEHRRGETAGLGRCIHRAYLEALDWKLWEDRLEKGLDGSMYRRLATLLSTLPDEPPAVSLWCGDSGMVAADVKTGTNIWSFDHFSEDDTVERVDGLALLGKSFPASLIAALRTLPADPEPPPLPEPVWSSKTMLDDAAGILNQGDLEAAEKRVRLVLGREPTNATALSDLARLLQLRGDQEGCNRELMRAALFADDPVQPLANLASIARAEGRLGHAEGYDRRVISLMDFDGGGGYRAAFAEINITLDAKPNSISLQGMWTEAPRRARAVVDPLRMQVLLLEDAAGRQALLVAADIFAFGPQLVEKIQSFAEDFGIPREAVMLNASRSAYGPGMTSRTLPHLGGWDEAYSIQLYWILIRLLPELYQHLLPCTLGWTRARTRIGFNSRAPRGEGAGMAPNPEAHYETDTPILVVRRSDGQRLVAANHGCQPTGLGPSRVLSAEFVGAFRERLLARSTSDVAMFLQGAAADIEQRRTGPAERSWADDAAGVLATGTQLADAVADAIQRGLTPIDGPLRAVACPFDLPLKTRGTPEEFMSDPSNAHLDPIVRKTWAAAVGSDYPDGPPATLRLEASALALGDVLFHALPGDAVTELAGAIRAGARGDVPTFVLGCTNGLTTYLPTDQMIANGDDEAYLSQLFYRMPAALDVGVEAALLDAVARGAEGCARATPSDPPSAPRSREHRSFFLMSSSLAGGDTLSDLLETASNTRVWRDCEPLDIERVRGSRDQRVVFWEARARIVRETWEAGQVYIETAHDLTPFAVTIAGDVLDARFLVLVRDPRTFVRLAMGRGYYATGGPEDDALLEPPPGSPEHAAWSQGDRFSKVCWLWAQTYTHIANAMGEIPPERVAVILFEEMVGDLGTAQAIFEFCELQGYDEDAARAVLERRVDDENEAGFPHPRDWTPAQHDTLWRLCGDVAACFGYTREYSGEPPRPSVPSPRV